MFTLLNLIFVCQPGNFLVDFNKISSWQLLSGVLPAIG